MPYGNDDPLPTRGEVAKGTILTAPVVFLVGAVVLAIGFGLVMLFQPWAHHIQDSEARHQGVLNSISASNYQNNPGAQDAWIQQMETAIQSIQGADPANAASDARTACQDAARIIIMPPGDQPWVNANCEAGGLRPGSQYAG